MLGLEATDLLTAAGAVQALGFSVGERPKAISGGEGVPALAVQSLAGRSPA